MATRTRSFGVLFAFALASSAPLFDSAPVSLAAEPSAGTIASPRDEVTWSGGPFTAPNPAVCPTAADPACDHFIVRIENPRVKRVLVAIAPDEGFEDDDYDLFVYDDQGRLVESNADGDGFESVIFEKQRCALL